MPSGARRHQGGRIAWKSIGAPSAIRQSRAEPRATAECTRMKIAIIGVGAIGGFVGAQLAHAGEDVTFIARGATLEALQDARHPADHERRQRESRPARQGDRRITRPRDRRTW